MLTRIPARYAVYEFRHELEGAKGVQDGCPSIGPSPRELGRVYVTHVEPTLNCPKEETTNGIENGIFDYGCDGDGEEKDEDSEVCV